MPDDRAAGCTTTAFLVAEAAKRSVDLLAHGVLRSRMVTALLIGVPLVLIVLYASWMAGELGLGPSWRRRKPGRPEIQDATDEEDDTQRVVNRR